MHAYARPTLWMRVEDACNDDVKAGVLVMILVEDRYGYGVSEMEETATANGRLQRQTLDDGKQDMAGT